MPAEIKPINRKIAGYRKLAGYTQAQAAELLGLKRNTYARIEHHGNPSLELINKLAALYKVPVESFLIDNPPSFSSNQHYNPMLLREPNLFDTSDVLPLSLNEADIIRILRAMPKDLSDKAVDHIKEMFASRHNKD